MKLLTGIVKGLTLTALTGALSVGAAMWVNAFITGGVLFKIFTVGIALTFIIAFTLDEYKKKGDCECCEE